MADISKCEANVPVNDELVLDCPWKENCWRHKAPDSMYQSYFMIAPGKFDERREFSCAFYWPINEIPNDETHD